MVCPVLGGGEAAEVPEHGRDAGRLTLDEAVDVDVDVLGGRWGRAGP